MEKNIIYNYSPDDLAKIFREILDEALQELNQIKSMQGDGEELLTRIQAMGFLKVRPTKFNELRRNGCVIPIRIGKKTLYSKKDLLEFTVSRKSAGGLCI